MAQSKRGTWECTAVDVVPFEGERPEHVGELLIWDPETIERGDARAAVPLTRAQAQELIEELSAMLKEDAVEQIMELLKPAGPWHDPQPKPGEVWTEGSNALE